MKMKTKMGKFTWKHAVLIAVVLAILYCLAFGCNLGVNAFDRNIQFGVGNKDPTVPQISAGAQVAVGTPSMPQFDGPAGYSPSMNFGSTQ